MSDEEATKVALPEYLVDEIRTLLLVRCWDRHGGAFPNCEYCWESAPRSMAAVGAVPLLEKPQQ